MDPTPHLDTSLQILDLLSSFDSAIQKAIIKSKLAHPTYIQAQLFPLYSKRQHFLLQSGQQSGKTTGLIILQMNKIIEEITNKKENNGLEGFFGVILGASKEACLKNILLAEKLLVFAGKTHNIAIKNLNEINGNDFGLIPNTNYIFVATPTKFLTFFRATNLNVEAYVSFIFDDCEYLISFGYEDELAQVKDCFKSETWKNMQIMLSTSDQSEEIKALKAKVLQKSVYLKLEDEEKEEEEEQDTEDKELITNYVNQIYHMGPNIHKFIMIYVSFKLNFISGKTIILCNDDNSLYKVDLFLKRTGIPGSHIYNNNDPKNLRAYILSVFNSGLIKILVAKTDFFENFKNLKCLQKIKGGDSKKMLKIALKPVENIILFDVKGLESDSEKYFNLMKELYKPKLDKNANLITLVENDDKEKDFFSKLIEFMKKNYKKINLNTFPLKAPEVEAFKYRISDVVSSITLKQIKVAKMLDFKRQLIKSKKMHDYFSKNPNEKKILVDSIQKLSSDLNRHAIKLTDEIPTYLLPEIVKSDNQVFSNLYNPRKRILIRNYNENFEESLRKRMENNDLTLDDVKKKINIDNTKSVFINEETEDPGLTDPDRLKPLSNRKLWKIKHKFSLKKKNKRLEKKGIFQS